MRAGAQIRRKVCESNLQVPERMLINDADSGSIYVTVDCLSAPANGFQQILADCRQTLEFVRQLCKDQWKKEWNTDPARIVLSGSSA